MKNLITITLLLLTLAMPLSAQRTYTLIIGVSRYQNSQHDLAQTASDAKAFQKVMRHHTQDINILTSKYATKDNVLNNLSAICKNAGTQDRIIFYFSGHGTEGGLVAHDGIIYNNQITAILKTSVAKEIYCFIDACHAGTMANTKADETLDYNEFIENAKSGKDNMVFFLASRPEEYSFENPIIGKGYFTQAMLKGIRGKSDSNGDKKVTVIELFNYIYKDVQNSVKENPDMRQHPQLIAPKSTHNNVIVEW